MSGDYEGAFSGGLPKVETVAIWGLVVFWWPALLYLLVALLEPNSTLVFASVARPIVTSWFVGFVLLLISVVASLGMILRRRKHISGSTRRRIRLSLILGCPSVLVGIVGLFTVLLPLLATAN